MAHGAFFTRRRRASTRFKRNTIALSKPLHMAKVSGPVNALPARRRDVVARMCQKGARIVCIALDTKCKKI